MLNCRHFQVLTIASFCWYCLELTDLSGRYPAALDGVLWSLDAPGGVAAGGEVELWAQCVKYGSSCLE